MLTRTRFRDVPFEEVACCMVDNTSSREFWERVRGTEIQIDATPLSPTAVRSDSGSCNGPFWMPKDSRYPGYNCVCPHIVDID